MIKWYPVSDLHLRVFNYQPVRENCLSYISADDLKNLTGFIIFIWLKNKKGFWFKVHSVSHNTIEGYMMIQSYWRYRTFYLSEICRYY